VLIPEGIVPVGLREKPPDGKGGPASGADEELLLEATPEEGDQSISDPEAGILCRRCAHTITRPKDEAAMGGSFRHTFANPSGLVFEIGCFRHAEGCGASGELTDEFTWFRGYHWRLALCRACFVHLGWEFVSSSGSGSFWGLILNRLSFPI
jgi:hypothetical protein